ncbi:hypothetical protein HanLR1_Chr08g0279061 [Helianthus annuus]|nr:hypothetical protein HanHA89_Chr08g0297401 [Helianthus annuus]KAJ0719198.1 hypothetical protein HanLR1_Chr08g0279061 [Helianthus annuus]
MVDSETLESNIIKIKNPVSGCVWVATKNQGRKENPFSFIKLQEFRELRCY